MSNVLLDHVKNNRIIIDDSTENDRAIVQSDGLKTNTANSIRLIEGVIGMFGLEDLKEETMLFHTYLSQLYAAGIDDISITLMAESENEVSVMVFKDRDDIDAITLDIRDDHFTEKLNSFLSQCIKDEWDLK